MSGKMGKRAQNLVVQATSGAMGKELILREIGEAGVLAEKPTINKNRVPTKAQAGQQDKFAEAADYANAVLESPALKESYGVRATKKRPVFKIAFQDYLTAPSVKEIDTSEYKGTVGSVITVKAFDDFAVKQVKVSIFNAAGDLVEEGLAIVDPIFKIKYNYTATQVVAILPGCKIKAIAQDLPGNKGELQKTL
jgi:hypothetical protein